RRLVSARYESGRPRQSCSDACSARTRRKPFQALIQSRRLASFAVRKPSLTRARCKATKHQTPIGGKTKAHRIEAANDHGKELSSCILAAPNVMHPPHAKPKTEAARNAGVIRSPLPRANCAKQTTDVTRQATKSNTPTMRSAFEGAQRAASANEPG